MEDQIVLLGYPVPLPESDCITLEQAFSRQRRVLTWRGPQTVVDFFLCTLPERPGRKLPGLSSGSAAGSTGSNSPLPRALAIPARRRARPAGCAAPEKPRESACL